MVSWSRILFTSLQFPSWKMPPRVTAWILGTGKGGQEGGKTEPLRQMGVTTALALTTRYTLVTTTANAVTPAQTSPPLPLPPPSTPTTINITVNIAISANIARGDKS